MGESQHAIFRARALQHRQYKYKKDVLPHLVSPPVFLFLWILLGLLLIVMVLLLPGLGSLIGG
jgi:hypothetical protein